MAQVIVLLLPDEVNARKVCIDKIPGAVLETSDIALAFNLPGDAERAADWLAAFGNEAEIVRNRFADQRAANPLPVIAAPAPEAVVYEASDDTEVPPLDDEDDDKDLDEEDDTVEAEAEAVEA